MIENVNKNKKVIIVGAGIGGLATALRLLKNGFSVKIIEKENYVGGKVNLLEERGFKFDLTASIMMILEPYKELIEYIGKDFYKVFNIININPIYRVFSYDGDCYDFCNEFYKITKTLKKFSLEDTYGYINFLSNMYENYLSIEKEFLDVEQIDKVEMLNLKTLKKLEKIKTYNTADEYIKKFIANENLKNFVLFQSMYVGISPFQGPSVYTLIPMISQVEGLWHIKGGMYEYIRKLEKYILELGGEIETNKEVNKIIINNNIATGIISKNTIENCDILVCNSDFAYTMKNLISINNRELKLEKYKFKKIKYSCGTFIMYLALDKKYENLQVHNIYLNKEFRKNIEKTFNGQLPQSPSIYMYCPSKIDRSVVPKGKELLNIIVRIPNMIEYKESWDENHIALLKSKIFDILVSIKGLEDIKENIIFEKHLSPKDLEKKFNIYGGYSFGISPTLTQTNWFKPQCKVEDVSNLYFVGDCIHPGSGIAMVLKSSKIVSNMILRDA